MANKSSLKQDKHSKDHDLKDQILEQPFIHRITDWVSQNLRIIGIVVGLVILALIIGKFWMNYKEGQVQKAAALEGKAMQLHQEASQAAANVSEEGAAEEADKLYQETIENYQQILDDFAGTASAERAIFFLGSLEYERENYTQSREYFSQYLKKYAQGTFVLNAKESLAYIFEQEGEYQKALESFKELEKSVSDSKKADIQLAIARNYRSLDQKEDALKVYQEILDSSTAVSVKDQAREALAVLESDQEFPPPSEIEEVVPEASPVEEAQPEAEASPEAPAQPEAEAVPEAPAVEEAQPEAEASPEASTVEEAQPEAEASPEASPVEEVQPEAEASPEASPVEEAQPEAEASPEAPAQPEAEAVPEAPAVEEAQPEAEASPEASAVEEAQPEAEAVPEAPAQPEAEAVPEAPAVEEAQPEAEASPEASTVEEAQPEAEASPVEENTPAAATSEGTN